MAIVSVPPFWLTSRSLAGAASGVTVDAAGESSALVGQVFIPGGGSKTISSSGGAILWRTGGSVTFSNGSTNVRVGVQDVNPASGLDDGTFDVYADLVGGTDALAANTWYATAMESGSKTIAHGDVIALVVEMTARGGSDSVQLAVGSSANPYFSEQFRGFPYATSDGGTHTKTSNAPVVMLQFDDGTWAWFVNHPSYAFATASTQSFNNGSTPDEYACIFSLAFPCRVSGLMAGLAGLASTDTFELLLYADPYGTPSALATIAQNPFFVSGNLEGVVGVSIADTTLAPGAYAIAVGATSPNDIGLRYADFTAVGEPYKRFGPLGPTAVMAARTDRTGAFSVTQTYHLPYAGLMITGLHDGAGGGGGGAIVPQGLHSIEVGIAA